SSTSISSGECSMRALSSDRLFTSACPPPRISTLFPYTTLFRSRRLSTSSRRGGRTGVSLGRRLSRRRQQPGAHSSRSRRFSSGADRKSTRLNSSHQIISYAVFCLKKKKKYKKHHYNSSVCLPDR